MSNKINNGSKIRLYLKKGKTMAEFDCRAEIIFSAEMTVRVEAATPGQAKKRLLKDLEAMKIEEFAALYPNMVAIDWQYFGESQVFRMEDPEDV